jgi:peroxiredoxin Q/BCP
MTQSPESPGLPPEDAGRVIPEVGQPAPEIVLPDQAKAVRRLSDQRGRWTVLFFYPEDDTPGCTTEACQFRDLHAEISAADADVWGVSPDDAASHQRFRAKHELPFTLLSDEDHDVATRYGAWGLKTNYGRTFIGMIRSSFLVDPDGRIARAWPRVKADGHAAQVLAALAEAKAARGT